MAFHLVPSQFGTVFDFLARLKPYLDHVIIRGNGRCGGKGFMFQGDCGLPRSSAEGRDWVSRGGKESCCCWGRRLGDCSRSRMPPLSRPVSVRVVRCSSRAGKQHVLYIQNSVSGLNLTPTIWLGSDDSSCGLTGPSKPHKGCVAHCSVTQTG